MSPDITKGLRHWDEGTNGPIGELTGFNLVFGWDPGRAHG